MLNKISAKPGQGYRQELAAYPRVELIDSRCLACGHLWPRNFFTRRSQIGTWPAICLGCWGNPGTEGYANTLKILWGAGLYSEQEIKSMLPKEKKFKARPLTAKETRYREKIIARYAAEANDEK